MKNNEYPITTRLRGKALCASAILGLILIAGPASAQLSTPLGLRTASTTVDEMGQPLQGHWDEWPPNGDLVMILWASNNMIFPPIDIEGTPDPRNPPVLDMEYWTNGITYIGMAGLGPLSPPGTFDISVSNTVRYNSDRWVFARVFNAHTPAGASFYGDSDLQKIPADGSITFTIDRTRYALDTGDNDDDGLNNSMEESLGTNPDNSHSDTDGVNDWEEWVAGTDGRNPDSVFILARLQRGLGNEALVAWDSVSGKRYEVQYTADPLDGITPPVYTVVSGGTPILASGAAAEFPVPAGLSTQRGFFRIRVLHVDE